MLNKVTFPGGSNTDVQYNSGGAFAGSSGLTYDGTSLKAVAQYSGGYQPAYVAHFDGYGIGSPGVPLWAVEQNAIGFSFIVSQVSWSDTTFGEVKKGWFIDSINIPTLDTTRGFNVLDGKELMLMDSTNTYGVGFKSPAGMSASSVYTLPPADGSTGQVLKTNGSKVLSWTTVSASPGGSNTQVQFNDSGAFAGNSGFFYDKTNHDITVGNRIYGGNDGTGWWIGKSDFVPGFIGFWVNQGTNKSYDYSSFYSDGVDSYFNAHGSGKVNFTVNNLNKTYFSSREAFINPTSGGYADILAGLIIGPTFTDWRGLVISIPTSIVRNPFEFQNTSGVMISGFMTDTSWRPPHIADADALNDTNYFSTTASKMAYKDSGGTVHYYY